MIIDPDSLLSSRLWAPSFGYEPVGPFAVVVDHAPGFGFRGVFVDDDLAEVLRCGITELNPLAPAGYALACVDAGGYTLFLAAVADGRCEERGVAAAIAAVEDLYVHTPFWATYTEAFSRVLWPEEDR